MGGKSMFLKFETDSGLAFDRLSLLQEGEAPTSEPSVNYRLRDSERGISSPVLGFVCF